MKISKQEYTTEFKELSVKRVKSGQSIGVSPMQFMSDWLNAPSPGKLVA